MASFERYAAAWREAPFPPGSSNDQLDEVHADLALIDSWVAESLLPYIQSEVWEPATSDVLGALDRLEQSVSELMLDPNDEALARQYVAYVYLLRAAYDAFLHLEPR